MLLIELCHMSLKVFPCYLKVISSTCFVLLSYVKRNKLCSRSTICIFLGYGDSKKGYHCYNIINKQN